MHLQTLLPLLSLLALTDSAPTDPIQNRAAGLFPVTPACYNHCGGTAFNASLQHIYICGDSRLGPVSLPMNIPLSSEFTTYDRFGGLCPGTFLKKWYNTTAGSYIYPPLNGFQLNTAGAPIMGTVTLQVGLLIDRFGSEYGTFVSPEGAPYMQRALPPSNLDTPPGDPRYPYNYHVYKVTKKFNAVSGPIAAWFGQPGQGVQYQLSSSIMTLLAGGFIKPVDIKSQPSGLLVEDGIVL